MSGSELVLVRRIVLLLVVRAANSVDGRGKSCGAGRAERNESGPRSDEKRQALECMAKKDEIWFPPCMQERVGSLCYVYGLVHVFGRHVRRRKYVQKKTQFPYMRADRFVATVTGCG